MRMRLPVVLAAVATCLAVAALRAEDDASATKLEGFATFAPAFTESAIDFGACKQVTDGKSEAADAWRVRRTFGLVPSAGNNWKEHQLTLPAGDGGKQHSYGFLFVFKAPVEIGTLSVTPADVVDPQRSANGGEVLYIPGDVKDVPDPVRAESQWKKVSFASPAQHLRFSTFPKGTMVKALYYKDVRVKGGPELIYLNAYKNRFENITSAAVGSATPAPAVKDAAALPQGKSVFYSAKASDAAPITYTLTWKDAHRIDGVFLYSNADQFRFLALDPAEKDPAKQWKPVKFSADWDNMHSWEGWHYSYRWLSFPAVETSALKVEITAADGATPWITGLGTVTLLKD